ncbi:MAG: hypothetical protein AAGB23_09760 [Pseudomonadota bacterium]
MKTVLAMIPALLLVACSDLGAPATLEDALKAAQRVGTRPGVAFHDPEERDIVETIEIEAPDTLVIRHSNVKTIDQTIVPHAFERSVREYICKYQVLRDVIEMGGTIRLEITTNIGSKFPAVHFSRC